MFKGNFYDIVGKSSDLGPETTFSIKLNKEHTIYKAHFPEQPITPGVVQLEIVKELVSELLGRPVAFVSIHRCKFLAILDPNQHSEVTIKLQLSDSDGFVKVNASICEGDLVFLKLSSKYR